MLQYLLHWSISLEENVSTEQLSKDAAHRPHINSHRVVASTHQYLRCPVILRHHLARHRHIIIRFNHSSQAKVTDLKTLHCEKVNVSYRYQPDLKKNMESQLSSSFDNPVD